jgi:hypothetical protein
METIIPMSKLFIKLIVLIFTLLPFLAYGAESDWEALLKLKDNYYYLDNQQFNKISCSIQVPLMANSIEQIKNQLAPLQKKVTFKHDLSSFILSYSPKSGLSFSDPEFDIILTNEEGVADPEKFKNGIAMIKTGIKMQVDGVKDTLTGIFDDYRYPQKGNYQDLVVTKDKGGYLVKYTHNGNNIKEYYTGNTIETSQNGMKTKINSRQNYLLSSNNKLIIDNGSALIDEASGTMKADFTVKYQNVQNIIFPKMIKSDVEMVISSMSQKGTVEINLNNCHFN